MVAALAYKQMRDAIATKPRGFTAIGVFLFFGAVMATFAATTLLRRGTPLDRLWALNPTAYNQLAPLGGIVVIFFLALAATLITAGIGWFRRRLWGWRLAVIIISTQVLGELQPTLEAIRQQARQTPQEVMTDSGYCSEANLKYLEKKRSKVSSRPTESYRDRQQSGPRGPLPQGATRVDRMRRKLQTQVGAAIYSRRKTVVEPVFGQIKQAHGFRQFLLRGLEKVQGEWAVICLTHNNLKLHRLCYG